MSRKTVYTDKKLLVVIGDDHVLGMFVQIFDKDMESETEEGEGLILDWSIKMGFETNLTGISNKAGVIGIIEGYIAEHGDESGTVELDDITRNILK